MKILRNTTHKWIYKLGYQRGYNAMLKKQIERKAEDQKNFIDNLTRETKSIIEEKLLDIKLNKILDGEV